MGWEKRGNGRYYYEKRRVDGRVRSVYVGHGLVGELSEQWAHCKRTGQLDTEEEFNAALDADCEYHDRRAIEAREREVLANERMLRAIVSEALRQAGYHQHKRQWRKRRSTQT
jgi:hypothetical protein